MIDAYLERNRLFGKSVSKVCRRVVAFESTLDLNMVHTRRDFVPVESTAAKGEKGMFRVCTPSLLC